MAKGYWIARVDVTDADTYKRYVAANGPAFARFGGRFLVRGGAFEAKEGTARERNVVIEFSSYAAALACYDSPEYRAVLPDRLAGSVAEVLVIEGYDGPQPGG